MKCNAEGCNKPAKVIHEDVPYCFDHITEAASKPAQVININVHPKFKRQSFKKRYAKQSAKNMVLFQLEDSFPEEALEWINDAHWIGPVQVPLDRVNFEAKDSWQASHEPELVKSKIRKIKKGKRKPVILVAAPKNTKYIIVDGHHRALAYEKLNMPMTAFIGKVHHEKGDWDTMHSKQLPQDPEKKI